MFMLMISLLTYILFTLYFYRFFKKYLFLSKLSIIFFSCFLALPALKTNSILFILEVHFIVFTIIIRCILHFFSMDRITKIIMCSILSLLLSGLCIGYGYCNARHIVKTEYYFDTDKTISDDYKIALLSDLHYPSSTTKSDVEELVSEINKENCDVVVLGGDIIDEHTSVEQREEVFQILGKLNQTSKVVYIYGNHDLGQYSINNKISSQELERITEDNGIEVLKDEILEINDDITLIGRDDYANKARLDINELLKKCNQEDYLIVLDHQPRDLDENADKGIDLHLSGHTHAGQIFPMYYMFELLNINELNYGVKKINQMHAINTSGAGVWGFPIRTQMHSEYVILHIK